MCLVHFKRNYCFSLLSKQTLKYCIFFSKMWRIPLTKILAFCILQLIKFDMWFHVFASFANRKPESPNKFVSFYCFKLQHHNQTAMITTAKHFDMLKVLFEYLISFSFQIFSQIQIKLLSPLDLRKKSKNKEKN